MSFPGYEPEEYGYDEWDDMELQIKELQWALNQAHMENKRLYQHNEELRMQLAKTSRMVGDNAMLTLKAILATSETRDVDS